jgi:hypothetical protein
MARGSFLVIVLGPDRLPLEGAQVTIRDADNNDALVYTARSGGSPTDNPMETDAKGRVRGFAEWGVYTAIATHESLGSPDTADLDVVSAEDEAIAVTLLADGAVTRDKLADELKPSADAAPEDEALRAIGDSADEVVAGNDSRLTDARTPTAHWGQHVDGDMYKIIAIGGTTSGLGFDTNHAFAHGLSWTPRAVIVLPAVQFTQESVGRADSTYIYVDVGQGGAGQSWSGVAIAVK